MIKTIDITRNADLFFKFVAKEENYRFGMNCEELVKDIYVYNRSIYTLITDRVTGKVKSIIREYKVK